MGPLGFLMLVAAFILAWAAYRTARRAQAQVSVLALQIDSLNARLKKAIGEIEQLRSAAPATAMDAAAAPSAPSVAAQVKDERVEPTQAPVARDLKPPHPKAPAHPVAKQRSVQPESAMTRESHPLVRVDDPPAPSAIPRNAPAVPVTSPQPIAPQPAPSEFEQRIAAGLRIAKQWLFGGNLVAKVGLLILFIGVAFLVRLTAPYFSVPIEFRLAGVAGGAIALLSWGWRIRERRRGIALPVQGAALAILMLVTFGAFKLFNLIPGGAAFAALFVLVTFTCLLAVFQDAMWLAIFGISGGFAAPILTASGSGNYVALFSYYCLLNAGVLAIALKRSWRALNVLGFAFTFVIGAVWGVRDYVPENYTTTQPFLIIFWLFYIAIAILYGTRRAPLLKSYVDGTLVFGVPTAAMALQYGLVKDIRFGMAFSALVAAFIYAATASALWRWRGGPLRLLVESFLALGVVFGTLAIPLAFDGRWTSAVWAVEGAAIVWVGLKQRQPLAWRFGILVQLASWIAFISALSGIDPAAALTNNVGLGFLLLGGAGVLMALMFRGQADPALDAQAQARARFSKLASGFIIAAAIWLLLGMWVEAWLRLAGGVRASTLVGTALLLILALNVFAKRTQWSLPTLIGGGMAIVAGLVFIRLMWVRMPWHVVDIYPQQSLGELLREGPLLGGSLLCGGALVSAFAFKHRLRASSDGAFAAVSLWFLLAVFWWCGFALHGVTHAAGYLTSSGETPVHWYRISFWAAYGVGLALSAVVWLRVAVKYQLLSEHTAQRMLWPILSWSGGAIFLLHSIPQLAWTRGGGLRLSQVAFSDAVLGWLGSPFTGALVLCALASHGAMRWVRNPVEPAAGHHWLLALGLAWYLLLLDPLAQFITAVFSMLEPIARLWQPRYPDIALLLATLSAVGFVRLAIHHGIAVLRWLAVPVFVLQAGASVVVLGWLYLGGELPRAGVGIALAGCWWGVAWSLRQWSGRGWPLSERALRCLHGGRVIAPWLMLMPVVSLRFKEWIWRDAPLAPEGWLLSGQWPDYIASWFGIGALLVLLRQAQRAAWPVQPLHTWYRLQLIPLATFWGVLLAIYWNLRQDGTMAPLPYLPVLNPLDLTSGFVAVLAMQVWRANRELMRTDHPLAMVRTAMALGFGWFNLMLLRTAAHYLPVPYRFADLYASQFVQVMVSIVWTLSSFCLMRLATRRGSKPLWSAGATLLGIVIVKLFLIDLSKVGDGARIVSFIGVGGLMLLIAYLAPLPRSAPAGNQPVAQRP